MNFIWFIVGAIYFQIQVRASSWGTFGGALLPTRANAPYARGS